MKFRLFAVLIFGLTIPSFAVTSEEYYQAGLSLYQKGDYPNAIKYLKAALQVDSLNWQANQVLGYAYYQSHDNQDALSAFDRSLATHPENPTLRAFSDQVRGTLSLPPPVTSATAPPPGSETVPQPSFRSLLPAETLTVFRPGKWSNVHVGPIFAAMGDFQTGAKAVKNNYAPTAATASVDNLGVILGAETGLCIDNFNAISLGFDAAFFNGYKDQFTFGFNTGTDSFTPMMAAIEVKYSRIIPMGSNRLRMGIGPGLYLTSLDAEQTLNTTTITSGAMSGLGFGGSLSFSYEIFLSPDFMLNVYGEGRFASTSNLQGDFQDKAGNVHKIGLVMDSQNFLGTAYTSYIGTNGLRWATVDYTGGNLGLGFSYRY